MRWITCARICSQRTLLSLRARLRARTKTTRGRMRYTRLPANKYVAPTVISMPQSPTVGSQCHNVLPCLCMYVAEWATIYAPTFEQVGSANRHFDAAIADRRVAMPQCIAVPLHVRR
jgi:hypothetical protein